MLVNPRKQLFPPDEADLGTLTTPEVDDQIGMSLPQRSPVLRPVQRSPTSDGSDAGESLDGSYLEMSSPINHQIDAKVMHSPPPEPPQDCSIPNFNLQDYVLQQHSKMQHNPDENTNTDDHTEYVPVPSQDANVEESADSNPSRFVPNENPRDENELIQDEAIAYDSPGADDMELFSPVKKRSTARVRSPSFEQHEGNSDSGEQVDNTHSDHASESENAEADQYLEDTGGFRMLQGAECSLHDEDGEENASENEEAEEDLDENETSSERYEPEGQYQGAYDRKLTGAQGYARAAHAQDLTDAMGTLAGDRSIPFSLSEPRRDIPGIQDESSITWARYPAQGAQALSRPSNTIQFASDSESTSVTSNQEPSRNSTPISSSMQRNFPASGPQNAQVKPSDSNSANVRKWVLNMDMNPNPEDEQMDDHHVTAARQISEREPTDGSADEQENIQVYPVVQEVQGASNQPLPSGFKLTLETDEVESEQTESCIEPSLHQNTSTNHSRSASESSTNQNGSHISSGTRQVTQGADSMSDKTNEVKTDDQSKITDVGVKPKDKPLNNAGSVKGDRKVIEPRQNPQGKCNPQKQMAHKSVVVERQNAGKEKINKQPSKLPQKQTQGHNCNSKATPTLSGIRTTKTGANNTQSTTKSSFNSGTGQKDTAKNSFNSATGERDAAKNSFNTGTAQRGEPSGSDPNNGSAGMKTQLKVSPKNVVHKNKQGIEEREKTTGASPVSKSASQRPHTPSIKETMKQDGLDLSPVQPAKSSAQNNQHSVQPKSKHQTVASSVPKPDPAQVTCAEIENMESVRKQLSAILNTASQSSETSGMLPSLRAVSQETHSFSGEGQEGPSISGNQSLSYSQYSAGGGGGAGGSTHFEEMLAFSAKYFTQDATHNSGYMSESSTSAIETKLLREALEKEQYRRRHCENQIQELHRKLLEAQQQLAVAAETDRKKDKMVEQLDRTLAQVVENWKRGEGDRIQKMRILSQEHEQMSKQFTHQQELIERMEKELETTVNRLSGEREKAHREKTERQAQLHEVQQQLQTSLNQLKQERMRNEGVEQEVKSLAERSEKQENQFTELKNAYDEESECWEEKEKEYLQKIEAITDNHISSMEEEKEARQQLGKQLAEKQRVLNATEKHVKELEIELDTIVRDRESTKIQIGLLEAKMESQQRKLEAAYTAEMEKRIAAKLEEAHQRMCASETELQERHRGLVKEITQKHRAELEEQLRKFRADFQEREQRYRTQEQSLNDVISSLKTEVLELKNVNSGYESQRSELTNRLQAMMTSHWSEALRLLQAGASQQDVNAALGNVYGSAPLKGKSVPEFTLGPTIATMASLITSQPPAANSQTQPVTSVYDGQELPQKLLQPAENDRLRPDSQATDNDVSLFSSLSDPPKHERDQRAASSQDQRMSANDQRNLYQDQRSQAHDQRNLSISSHQMDNTLQNQQSTNKQSITSTHITSVPSNTVAVHNQLSFMQGNATRNGEKSFQHSFTMTNAPFFNASNVSPTNRPILSLKPVNYGDEFPEHDRQSLDKAHTFEINNQALRSGQVSVSFVKKRTVSGTPPKSKQNTVLDTSPFRSPRSYEQTTSIGTKLPANSMASSQYSTQHQFSTSLHENSINNMSTSNAMHSRANTTLPFSGFNFKTLAAPSVQASSGVYTQQYHSMTDSHNLPSTSNASQIYFGANSTSHPTNQMQYPADTPKSLFQNLSAQNYQGVEFIRSQIEAQRQQVYAGVPEEGQGASTIMLHSPVQLDTSGIMAPPFPAGKAPLRSQQQQHHQAISGFSQHTESRDHSSASSGSRSVTWGDEGHSQGHAQEASFVSATSADGQAFRREQVKQTSNMDPRNRSELDYSSIGHKFESHESRQLELQRYVKMLLNRSPGAPSLSAENPATSSGALGAFGSQSPGNEFNIASPASHLDLSLGSEAPTPRPNSAPDFDRKQVLLKQAERLESPLKVVGLSEDQVGEISRLLNVYGDKLGADDGSAQNRAHQEQEVLSYLRETQQNRYEPAEQPNSSHRSPTNHAATFDHVIPAEGQGLSGSPRKAPTKARRSLEPAYNTGLAVRKQISTSQPQLQQDSHVTKTNQSNTPQLKAPLMQGGKPQQQPQQQSGVHQSANKNQPANQAFKAGNNFAPSKQGQVGQGPKKSVAPAGKKGHPIWK